MSFGRRSGITRIDRRTGPAAPGSGGDVNDRETMTGRSEITAVAAAVRAGDESAFSALAERHRRELLVHCYRMLGSFQDAEDAVQDALLRAWRYRETLKDGAPLPVPQRWPGCSRSPTHGSSRRRRATPSRRPSCYPGKRSSWPFSP